MSLIEIFSDYVFNKKDLGAYVEKRRSINERGEFNDAQLIQAEKNLQQLKKEDPKIYALMYKTLDEYVKMDRGHTIEYPINFIREVLNLYKDGSSVKTVHENYERGLRHHHQDA